MTDRYDTRDPKSYYDDPPLGIFATLSLGTFFCILLFFGDWKLYEFFAFVKSHLYQFFGIVGGYFGIGLCWSIFQAWFAAKIRGEPYREVRIEWLRKNGVDSDNSVPLHLIIKWREFVEQDIRLKNLSQRLLFRNQKSRIARTWVYWPASMLWFGLSDIITEIIKAVVSRLKDLYQKVMDFAHKDITEDFKDLTQDH